MPYSHARNALAGLLPARYEIRLYPFFGRIPCSNILINIGRSPVASAKLFEINVVEAYTRGAKTKAWTEGMIGYNRNYKVKIIERLDKELEIVRAD